MRSCELCGGAARMYCESDQASLCWDCDRKVHGANFLVAKHTRSLLCHGCQIPTGWKASGLNIGPAYSVCESCVREKDRGKDEERTDESEGSYDEEHEIDSEFDDEEEETDIDDEDCDEDRDNQVVPWSADFSPTPPVAASSDSSSDGEEEVVSGLRGGERIRLKRMRENPAVYSQDDGGSAASSSGDREAEFRALKQRKQN